MKQKYGNHGEKSNLIAEHIKQTQNIEKKLQEATMDGVRYGLIAMEVFSTAYAICFSHPSTMTKEQIEKRNKLITNFNKSVTEKYVPMAEVPQIIFDLFNKELENSIKISSVDWLKDSIVNNDPRLGAYF